MSGRADGRLSVDIIVNNYNYGRFVGEAVRSACAQSYSQVRVIAVDDGSTDDSRDVLRSFEEKVTLIFKENGGQASAMNAGLERSDGDLVIFLDADDSLHAQAAERVAATFAADPGLVKVQFRMDVIDAEGRPTGELKPPPRLPQPRGDLRSAELAFPFDLAWLPTSGNAFRRSALETILPIPEEEFPRAGADWHLIHLSTLLGRVDAIEDVSASYRVHGANSYEPGAAVLDLAHVRETIGYARSTRHLLAELADRLALPYAEPILSIADLGNRLISLRLEPALHPIPGDRMRSLLLDSVRAAGRRKNVSPTMKGLFVGWFLAMAASPRPFARTLAELFLFPGRRSVAGGLLGQLQRSDHGQA